ncbi:cation/H(+) antiporter 18-like isoform X2 [Cucumis sativus]|nr:cation/H(+) antiporter 18-like isoform X2 [Cucumis sativus]
MSSVLPHVVMLLSMTSFPVVACFLDEFEILNSDIGRLTCSSSMVCEICFWSVVSFSYVVTSFEEMSPETSLGFFLSNGLLMSLIVFGIRPGALWVVQNSPEGKPVKEIYIYAVFVALLICGLLVLLMPIFFIACGLRMNVFSIQNLENDAFRDALTLGLIMNCKGIELVILISWKVQNVMNDESFTIMIYFTSYQGHI